MRNYRNRICAKVTGLNQNTASPPGTHDRDRGWAPQLAQEVRLRQLEDRLGRFAVDGADVDAEIERAALLGALNRQQDAQQAFVEILRRAPTNFSALNEFGTLLTNVGAIDAACRVYAEAIAHHPENPIGHVNLANLLLRANRHAEARMHYEAVLAVDPEHAPAHQGLGAVLADIGDRAAARRHFEKGFRDHAVSSLPYRGTAPPVALLQLVSSGGGNIPTAPFLDDRVFLTSVIVADYFDPAGPLPPHQLIFNAIGDADLCQPALQAAARLLERASAPVVNDPRAVMKTGRLGNSEQLRAIPGVVTPRTTAMARQTLAGSDGAGSIADEGFGFPLLLRSPGYHTGRNFILVETRRRVVCRGGRSSRRRSAGDRVSRRPRQGRQGAQIPRHDDRRHDLSVASCDIQKLEGALLHLGYGRPRRSTGARRRTFSATCRQHSEARRWRRSSGYRDCLGLDYAGVDFAVGPDGDVLLFEANATMVIAPPAADERWNYRRAAIDRIRDAVVAMIRRKSNQPG